MTAADAQHTMAYPNASNGHATSVRRSTQTPKLSAAP
jgi:hypothetical protein